MMRGQHICCRRTSCGAGNQHTQAIIPFGPFEANLQTQELRKQGVRLRLPGQSFQILKMLLGRPGGLVTREELQQALWPLDTHVDFEHGVNAAVNRLRNALEDSADSPQLIETLPRRGYRFVSKIDISPNPNGNLDGHRGRRKFSSCILVGAACAVTALILYLRFRPPSD